MNESATVVYLDRNSRCLHAPLSFSMGPMTRSSDAISPRSKFLSAEDPRIQVRNLGNEPFMSGQKQPDFDRLCPDSIRIFALQICLDR